MAEEVMHDEDRRGFFGRLFGRSAENDDDEQPEFKRKLFDGRIEKFLDHNLDSYISEYGIVTGLDLEVYEERYGRLTSRISTMSEYMTETDTRLSVMERELQEVKKASGKNRKK